MVYLLADLLAGLPRKKLVALDHARVVRLEAGGLAGRAERVEHLVAPQHVLGIEVPHAAGRLETDFVCHVRYYTINYPSNMRQHSSRARRRAAADFSDAAMRLR